MALHVICDMCGKELDEQGALLFSPPHASAGEFPTSRKLHACRTCWTRLWAWMFPLGDSGERETARLVAQVRGARKT